MKKIAPYFIALLVAASSTAVAQKQTPPAGGTAKDFKLSDKSVQTLANGLKTTLVHYGELPKVTVSLIIKTGNVHESNDQIWLANFVGRLMREGTTTLNFAAL